MLVDEDDLFIRCGDGLGIGLRISDLVARVRGEIVEAGLVLLRAGDFLESTAGEVLKAGVHQLFANLVVVVAACLMGVERGGRCMV